MLVLGQFGSLGSLVEEVDIVIPALLLDLGIHASGALPLYQSAQHWLDIAKLYVSSCKV